MGLFIIWRLAIGNVLAVIDDARSGMVLLVVGVFDDIPHVHVLAQCTVLCNEVQVAFGLGVGGEPEFAVDLLVVGSEGW